jgi:hypothetical protein
VVHFLEVPLVEHAHGLAVAQPVLLNPVGIIRHLFGFVRIHLGGDWLCGGVVGGESGL